MKDLNATINEDALSASSQPALAQSDTPSVTATDGAGGKIKHIVAVISGKGGVGKTLVTGMLAVSLRRRGFRVGILDGDITGSSIAHIFGARNSFSLTDDGKVDPPRSQGGIKIVSMNMFLESESDPVAWGGPMIVGAQRQFYNDVEWDELDYLLVDSPPGTSDGLMGIVQTLPLDGIIIVSTPQNLAMMVVKKCIAMVRQMKGTIIGVVENMSYAKDPGREPLGSSAGMQLAALTEAPLLARLPIDLQLEGLSDAGRIEEYHTEACDMLVANFINAVQSGSALSM